MSGLDLELDNIRRNETGLRARQYQTSIMIRVTCRQLYCNLQMAGCKFIEEKIAYRLLDVTGLDLDLDKIKQGKTGP